MIEKNNTNKKISTWTDLKCIKDLFMLWTKQHVFTLWKIYTIVWIIKSKNQKHNIINIVNDLWEIHYIHYNNIFKYFEVYNNI